MVPSARELAHELVETLAPEELPSFALVAEPYLTDPRRATDAATLSDKAVTTLPGHQGDDRGGHRERVAELDEIREVALARALDLGMKKAKAETLADALVGALLRRRDK